MNIERLATDLVKTFKMGVENFRHTQGMDVNRDALPEYLQLLADRALKDAEKTEILKKIDVTKLPPKTKRLL